MVARSDLVLTDETHRGYTLHGDFHCFPLYTSDTFFPWKLSAVKCHSVPLGSFKPEKRLRGRGRGRRQAVRFALQGWRRAEEISALDHKTFCMFLAPLISVYPELWAPCGRNCFLEQILKGKLDRYLAVGLRNLSLYWVIWGCSVMAHPCS